MGPDERGSATGESVDGNEPSAAPRPRRGRPRKVPVEEQRQRILAAARATFAEYDYHGATIERVARTAGVTRPAVYEQFGAKEELFIAVVDDLAEQLTRVMGSRLRHEGDPSMRILIRSRVAGLFEFLALYPEAAAIWAILRRGVVGAARERAAGARRNLEATITNVYERHWVPAGEISTEAARLLAIMTITSVESVGFRQPGEPRWEVESTIDFVTDFVMGGLMRLATRPGGVAHWGSTGGP